MPLIPITKIEPREADGKTEIIVEGAEPILQFTSYQVTEPLRLFVDISDADVRNLQEKITVGRGAVIDISPSQRDNTARLEIGLSQTADTKVYQSNGKLIVEIAKPSEEPSQPSETPLASATSGTTAPEVPAASGEQAGKADQRGSASIVTSVKATAGKQGVKVVISANGTMVPNTFMLEGKKLVVDIPDAQSKVRPSVIPVRKGGLDKVRVGQHSKPEQKVRIVLDLTKPMTYTATPEGNKIMIAMSAAPAGAPTTDAAAVDKEKGTAGEGWLTPEAEKTVAAETAVPDRRRACSAAAPPAESSEEKVQTPVQENRTCDRVFTSCRRW